VKTIFSKIIDKEIPCYLVAENNFAIAFMDINPIAKGHVLVVPKIQVDYLFDLDDDTYHKLWDFVKLVSKAIEKTIHCNRVGVSVVGLEVPHAHVHLIPINSVSDMSFSNKVDMSSEEIERISIDIRNTLL
tara:strand:+ start:960 stop:1352 length:393 start_codon:yes stop_codon:yes gene_type:complete